MLADVDCPGNPAFHLSSALFHPCFIYLEPAGGGVWVYMFEGLVMSRIRVAHEAQKAWSLKSMELETKRMSFGWLRRQLHPQSRAQEAVAPAEQSSSCAMEQGAF